MGFCNLVSSRARLLILVIVSYPISQERAKFYASTLQASWQAHFINPGDHFVVINNICLHPSGSAFVTTGTDGRICLWDLQNYSLLRSIHPLEHSVLAVAFHGHTFICGGKDGGGAEAACGLFNKIVAWDLSDLSHHNALKDIIHRLAKTAS
jgi:WD40 repeat protein